MLRRLRGAPARRGGVGALAVVALLGFSACGGEGDGAGNGPPGAGAPGGRPGGPPGADGGPGGATARPTPVSAIVAQPGDLEVTLRVSTNLRAREQVELIPKQAGVVAAIMVEEGARVREGQVLAQLDDAEWRLQLQQSEARASSALDAVERARALQDLELVSAQEVERLASEARVAEAEVGLTRLRVENAQIRAPIAGTVTHRYIERGQQVNTASPAFGLADLDRLQAQLAIPEREAHRVQVGQIARISLQEGAPPVAQGEVERIRPVVDAASGTVQVTVTVPSGSAEVTLRPGQFVNVDVVTETLTDRITLPRTAVLVDGAAPRIFLINDGQAMEREVGLGYSRGDRVEIRYGLNPGETVVVVGQDNLRPFAPIRLMQLDGQPVTEGGSAAASGDAPSQSTGGFAASAPSPVVGAASAQSPLVGAASAQSQGGVGASGAPSNGELSSSAPPAGTASQAVGDVR
jgi:membrane fusion protein, multidrug efflux system